MDYSKPQNSPSEPFVPTGDLLRVEVKLDAAMGQLKRLETLVIEIHRELNNAGMMTVGKQLDF